MKLTAYLLILALSALFVFAGISMARTVTDAAAFESKTYAESSVCAGELSRVEDNLLVMQYNYESEENVRAGGAVDEYALYQTIYDGSGYTHYKESREAAADNGDAAVMTTPATALVDNSAILDAIRKNPDWNMFQDGMFLLYLSENPVVVEEARQAMITNQLRNFQRVKTFLGSIDAQFAFSAYRVETDSALKNEETDAIRAMPIFTEYDLLEESMAMYRDGQERHQQLFYDRNINGSYQIGAKDKLLVGVRPEYLALREQEWTRDHQTATDCVTTMVVCMVLAVLLLLYLCVVTGRAPGETGVQLSLLDRMYSEVHVTVLVLLLSGFAVLMAYLPSFLNMWPMVAAATGGMLAIALPLLLSLVRSLKAHRFFRSFALGRLALRFFHWCVRFAHGVWQGGSQMGRGILLAVLVPLACMPLVTVPFIIAALVYAVYRTVRRFQKLVDGVREVRGGNLDYKIDVSGGDIGALAEDINALSEGLDTAISSEVRAERLKTELISNVSHDIKTPLTSIVTYVDLLKTELAKEAPNEQSLREYAEVIDQKTNRLRVLTTDLFEAAKATSGAMTVNLEQVDVQALVRQGLGEFDDKLAAAQLDVRVAVPEKPAYISADGRLVWRIFENMLSNVVKYALTGSRVYLDVTTGHGMVTLTMKNISAYELNVPAEELLERFKRGDEARSSDGSGLGLSIAMSLAQLQHGFFTIAVDGDLFKAVLSMPLYREEPAQENDRTPPQADAIKK